MEKAIEASSLAVNDDGEGKQTRKSFRQISPLLVKDGDGWNFDFSRQLSPRTVSCREFECISTGFYSTQCTGKLGPTNNRC